MAAAAPLGKCPSCDATHDPRRVLASEVYASYPAPGVDTETWFWVFRVSCAGCLSAVKVQHGFNGQEIALATAGTEVARLRDRLATARTDGRLSEELLSLSPDEWILAGTPELFAEIAEAIGRRLRLSVIGVLRSRAENVEAPFESVVSPPWRLEPVPAKPKPRATKKKTTKKPPPKPEPKKEESLPAGTALTLVGIREGLFLCECPSAGGRNFLVSRTLVERAD